MMSMSPSVLIFLAVFSGVLLRYTRSLFVSIPDNSTSPYPQLFCKGRTWFSNRVYFNDPWSFLQLATKNGPSMIRLASLRVVAIPGSDREGEPSSDENHGPEPNAL